MQDLTGRRLLALSRLDDLQRLLGDFHMRRSNALPARRHRFRFRFGRRLEPRFDDFEARVRRQRRCDRGHVNEATRYLDRPLPFDRSVRRCGDFEARQRCGALRLDELRWRDDPLAILQRARLFAVPARLLAARGNVERRCFRDGPRRFVDDLRIRNAIRSRDQRTRRLDGRLSPLLIPVGTIAATMSIATPAVSLGRFAWHR